MFGDISLSLSHARYRFLSLAVADPPTPSVRPTVHLSIWLVSLLQITQIPAMVLSTAPVSTLLRLSSGRKALSSARNWRLLSSRDTSFDMAYGPVNAFQMNQYVIACTAKGEAAIVDCGATKRAELDSFLQWIETKNYKLTAVWQTHAHLDHIAGLGFLTSKPKYSDIPIYLHEREREIYNNFEQRCTELGLPVEDNVQPPPDTQLTFFDDDCKSMKLGELTFDVISTPGHSPGHVGFLEATHTKVFFGGDFIMQGSIGRTDFLESSHEDMQASLHEFATTQDNDTVIYPGHGPATTLGHEKQANPFLRALM